MIGVTSHRYRPRNFGIHQADRLLHTYIIGQTGTGKSTLLLNLMRQDIELGNGFCLIDPHGDLAEAVASGGNQNKIVWNPSDPHCPYGYNPLTRVSGEYRPLVVSGLIDTLKKQWSDAWGARMEHLLRYALLALLEQPNATIQDILPMFLDDRFRSQAIVHITDSQVRSFWDGEFKSLKYKNAPDGVAPIANKLGGFLAHPLVRKAICNPEKPLRLRKIMDEGKFLIINLAKGKLGADISNVLGGLMVTSLAHAAYTRQNIPEAERRPFFLYVDEFHSFTTDAFSELLAELRKYGVGLIFAHQHTVQLKRSVLEAILGNVGSMFIFRIGATDAHIFAKQLMTVAPEDLIGQGNYEVFVRLMLDGQQSKAFTAKTLLPSPKTC